MTRLDAFRRLVVRYVTSPKGSPESVALYRQVRELLRRLTDEEFDATERIIREAGRERRED